MARKIRDASLDSRDARRKLKPRDPLYVRLIDRGLHLGYRRPKALPGTWWARHYLGNGKYEPEFLGIADDTSDPDGLKILDFWQAQDESARVQGAADTRCIRVNQRPADGKASHRLVS